MLVPVKAVEALGLEHESKSSKKGEWTHPEDMRIKKASSVNGIDYYAISGMNLGAESFPTSDVFVDIKNLKPVVATIHYRLGYDDISLKHLGFDHPANQRISLNDGEKLQPVQWGVPVQYLDFEKGLFLTVAKEGERIVGFAMMTHSLQIDILPEYNDKKKKDIATRLLELYLERVPVVEQIDMFPEDNQNGIADTKNLPGWTTATSGGWLTFTRVPGKSSRRNLNPLGL